MVNSRLHCISSLPSFFSAPKPAHDWPRQSWGPTTSRGAYSERGEDAGQRAAVMFPIVCTRYYTSLHEAVVNGPRKLLHDHRLRSHKRCTCEEFAISLLLYCVFLTFTVFGSWAGAAVLNLLGIVAVFGLGVGVTIAGVGAELAAVVPGG